MRVHQLLLLGPKGLPGQPGDGGVSVGVGGEVFAIPLRTTQTRKATKQVGPRTRHPRVFILSRHSQGSRSQCRRPCLVSSSSSSPGSCLSISRRKPMHTPSRLHTGGYAVAHCRSLDSRIIGRDGTFPRHDDGDGLLPRTKCADVLAPR